MIALVAAAGMAFPVSAQEEDSFFECYVNGEVVKNGDRIDITKFYEELTVEGFGVYKRQYNTHLVVVPAVGDEMVVTVSDFSNDTPLDDNEEYGADLSVQFCGFTGSCSAIQVGDTYERIGETTPDKEIDMMTEIMVGSYGSAVGDDFAKMGVKAEFTMTFQLDEQVTVLTFFIDQKGIDAAVEGIESESNVAPVYYDLQGRRVEAPAKGLYIVKKGNKVSKEYIR